MHYFSALLKGERGLLLSKGCQQGNRLRITGLSTQSLQNTICPFEAGA